MLAPADVTEIDDGLWRWTAVHPEWVAGEKPESTGDWPREVGSVAYETDGTLVLIDALVPAGGEALWKFLDERSAAVGGTVAALTTIQWHRRSRDEVVARYAASTSRARASSTIRLRVVCVRPSGRRPVSHSHRSCGVRGAPRGKRLHETYRLV